ncbi:MAG TPA: protein translocase subunit SecD [Nocardioides sp.]|nr:protein translocase subunit SecD [Nocardioides sp.]
MAKKPVRPARTLMVFFLGVAIAYGLVALNGSWTPSLGLDLQGGTRIQLTASSDPSEESLDEARSIIDQRVNGQGVAEAEVTTQGGNQIVVEIPGESAGELEEVVKRQAQLRFRLVACSDFSPCGSGTQTPQNPLTPSAEPTAELPEAPQSPNRPPVGFDRAADPTGEPSDEPKQDQTPSGGASPSEPSASESAPVDDVPGVDDEGFTAPVDEELAWSQAPDPAVVQLFEQFTCADDGTLQKADGTPATVAPDAPVTVPAVDDPSKPLITCEPAENNPGTDSDRPATKYLLSRSVINGTDLDSASAGVPQNEVSWVVNLEVGGDGQDAFTAISRALVGSERQFAIVLDGEVISAPTMDGLITNGQAQISGNFTESSANALATSLKFGALPITFADDATTVEEIGPTLAGNQLAAGITAGLIGLGLVMLYCLLYYRGLGLVVVASLAVAAGVTYAMVLLLGEAANFTLTLPGIAGLIVAVGITADSFIVYFERIRDEMREGKSMRVAVESGWVRARNTCLAADAVSILAAIALFIFAVGVVKGFAFALGLSTIIDVVVFFFFTKPMVSWLARFKFFNRGHKLSGLDANALGVDSINLGTAGGRA